MCCFFTNLKKGCVLVLAGCFQSSRLLKASSKQNIEELCLKQKQKHIIKTKTYNLTSYNRQSYPNVDWNHLSKSFTSNNVGVTDYNSAHEPLRHSTEMRGGLHAVDTCTVHNKTSSHKCNSVLPVYMVCHVGVICLTGCTAGDDCECTFDHLECITFYMTTF